MEDVQVQSDVEQATGTPLPGDIGHSPGADAQHHPSRSINDIIAERIVVLSFRELQLKRIAALQDKLILLSSQVVSGKPSPVDDEDEVDEVLGTYAQALRNFETLTMNTRATVPIGARLVGSMGTSVEQTSRPVRRPLLEAWAKFILTILPGLKLNDDFLRAFLPFHSGLFLYSDLARNALRIIGAQQDLESNSPSTALEAIERQCGELGIRELDQAMLQKSETAILIERIAMGLWGGIALIVPVLIMVLCPSQNTNLITVSVATIWFALAFATGVPDGTGKDVFAATAAYAAVLVVFFGTGGSST